MIARVQEILHKQIKYIVIMLLLLSIVNAMEIPYGIEGIIRDSEGNPVIASIKITNINSGKIVEGIANVTEVGRYSAAIDGVQGDLIEIYAEYKEEFAIRNFVLRGVEKLDITLDNELEEKVMTEIITSSQEKKIIIVKINNPLSLNPKLKINADGKDLGVYSMTEIPNQEIPVLVEEYMELSASSKGGITTTKTIFPKENFEKVTITIFPNKNSLIITFTVLAGVVAMVLVRRKHG